MLSPPPTPPPPLLPSAPPNPAPPPTASDRVAALNSQFARGIPSNSLAASGVLIRQFDRLDGGNDALGDGLGEVGEPWLPCPSTKWCHKLGDRWATSVINPNAQGLYYKEYGGIVLNTAAVELTLFCAYPEDGNSMAEDKLCSKSDGDGSRCLPGCTRLQCDARRFWDCSYPPSKLREALEMQLTVSRQRGGNRNNELVLDARAYAALLPKAVFGFFFKSNLDRGYVGRVRDAFARRYGIEPAQLPLMRLDLKGGGDRPFTLCETGADCHF